MKSEIYDEIKNSLYNIKWWITYMIVTNACTIVQENLFSLGIQELAFVCNESTLTRLSGNEEIE